MNGRTILLVEDNADDVELALYALSKCPVPNQIVVVRSGEEALDYIFGARAYAGRDPDERPALVLLDLKLPGIDGTGVLERLRASPAGRRVPVVILTTSDHEEDIMRSYDLGVNSYIRKPVALAAFTDVVNQLGLYWLVTNTASPQ